jgi:hypothetical protein
VPLHQKTPGEGGRRKSVHWVYIPTESGKSWNAWIAGPCIWLECHTKGRTKPCLECVTGGELKCDKCNPTNVPEITGFQPLYRGSDGRPCFVIVHEYLHTQISGLTFREAVVLGRDAGQGSGVWIQRPLAKRPLYTSTIAERMVPADITCSLLTVWKMPALDLWFASQHGSSAPTPVPIDSPRANKAKQTRLRGDGKPFSPMLQAAANNADCDPAPNETNEAFVAAVHNAVGRTAAASKNGKHE